MVAIVSRFMAGDEKKGPDYLYTGAFDQAAFQKAYTDEFKDVPKSNLASMADILFVVSKSGADSRITDIRWAAYMLATVFIETSHTIKVEKTTVNNKGKIKTQTVKVWRNFTPIEEVGHGKGKKYYDPVKVARLPNGDARVTEYDGDQWNVTAATGASRPLKKLQSIGVLPGSAESQTYKDDDGDPLLFFGRGYVQLTWWENYAKAGVAIGRGLAFLFDPNLANDRDTAYSILATGLYTGGYFANGRKFSQYFHGDQTDYVGARDMVNAGALHANKVEVAHVAEHFEKVLFASKVSTGVANK
jgi:hypothetical protein